MQLISRVATFAHVDLFEERHGGKLHLTIIVTLSLHLAKVSLIRMHLQMPATRLARRFHGRER